MAVNVLLKKDNVVNIFKKVLGAISRYVVYIFFHRINDDTPADNTVTRGYIPGEGLNSVDGWHGSDVDDVKQRHVKSPIEGIDGEEDF